MCVLSGMIGPFSKEGEVMMMMFYYLALKPATPPSKKLDKHTQAFCQNSPSRSKVFSWSDYPSPPLHAPRCYHKNLFPGSCSSYYPDQTPNHKTLSLACLLFPSLPPTP